MLGFLFGSLLGIVLAVGIVHLRVLDRSLLPWIIASQTVPILAIAPMVVVVLGNLGLTGLLPKAIISMYLCFFPVTIGMVKGLRSPDPLQLDLMRTYSATPAQVFWKLRWPAATSFLFASLKVAIAISLVGAIVGELPTGAQAGLGARLLSGSYYGQTIQIWSALIMASRRRGGAGGPGRLDRAAGRGARRERRREVRLADLLPRGADGWRAGRTRWQPRMGGPTRRHCLRARRAARGCAAVAALARDRSSTGWRFWRLLLGAAAPLILLAGAGAVRNCGARTLAVRRRLDAVPLAAAERAGAPARRGWGSLLAPALFGLALLYLWQVLVVGFGVPQVLLPAPAQVGHQLAATRWIILWPDFRQTFLKAVLAGFALGCGRRLPGGGAGRPHPVPQARPAAAGQSG